VDVRVTPGVKWLLIANTAAFLPGVIPGISGAYFHLFALNPQLAIGHFFVWQFLSYSFLHAGVFHYAFNMMALYFFGTEVEGSWGTRKFLWLYFLAALGAGLISAPLFYGRSVVGASGAVLALLYVFARMYPQRTILMFFVIPVPAILAVGVIGAISLFSAISGSGGNIAHLTHLGGLFVGWVFYRYQAKVEDYLGGRKQQSLEREWRHRAQEASRKRAFFEKEIDPILDKISQKGLHSLTETEKRKLKQAKEMRQ